MLANHIETLEISLSDEGKVLDKVSSYAAMRKFSTARDERGIVRMQLNNKPLFQFGPLECFELPPGLVERHPCGYTRIIIEAIHYFPPFIAVYLFTPDD